MLANYDLSSRWCEPCRFRERNLLNRFPGHFELTLSLMRYVRQINKCFNPIRSTLAIRCGERADEKGRRDEVVRLACSCRSGAGNEGVSIPGIHSASLLSFSISSTSSAGGALRCSSRSSHSNNQQQRLLAVTATGLRFWTIPRGQAQLR